MDRLNILAAAFVALCLWAVPASAAIIGGQVDDFENGTVLNWQGGVSNPAPPANISTGGPAGLNDNYMRLTSNGSFTAGGRLVTFNSNQWAGDYLAANIGSIQLQVTNQGTTDLALRLILLGPLGQNLATAASASVPAGSGWSTITFPLAPADLTGGNYAAVMSSVRELNLLHSPSLVLDRRQTPPIAAQIGIDNVTAVPLQQGPPTWNVDANGNWSQPANWTAGIPNAPGATAAFGDAITAPRTITLDVPVTAGRIDFDNPNAYTIAGTNALTLDATNGSGQVNVHNGSHSIAAPIALADDAVVNVAPALSSLSLIQPLNAGAFTLTKTGPGTLNTRGITAASLVIGEGKLVFVPGSGVSVVDDLEIGGLAPAPLVDVSVQPARVNNPSGVVGAQTVPEPATSVLLAVASLTAALGHAACRTKRRRRV